MAEILFASNNISHWPLSRSSTLANSFDSTRVPYSIELVTAEAIASPNFPEVAGDTTWIHFRTYFTDRTLQTTYPMLRVFDANQNLLCQLTQTFNTNDFLIWLTSYDSVDSTTQLSGFPCNAALMNQIDVKIQVLVGAINVTLYINGGQAAIANVPTNTAGWGNPTHFSLSASWADNSPVTTQHMSEILVSDTDTRNARMSLLRPVASGGETDWVGVAAELADNDPTSGMTSTAINQRQTVSLTAYAGASNISSMVVASQTVAGAGAPQNMRHLVRMSAVNYEGPADIPLSPVLQFDITDFQLNPATSLPWVAGDLATLEIGFISKT